MWYNPTNKIAGVPSPTVNPRCTLQIVDVTLCMLGKFSCYLSSANFFQNHVFQKFVCLF